MKKTLTHYYKTVFCQKLEVKGWLITIILLLSSTLLLSNNFFFHYQAFGPTFPLGLLKMFPAMSIFYVVGLFVEKECPRISAVLLAISKLYFFSMVLEFLVTMVQYTPFPLVDRQINHFDLMLGFSNANWMHWTQTHHWAMKLSLFFYSSLIYELLWVPILLALILQWRSLDVMYIGCLISAIIGFMIYYFFPTTEPAHVVHGVKFLPVEYKVVTQFMQMHHHQKVTSDMGGLVGLPSFHVVWAIIMVYAVRHQKWLFYPLIVFNSLIILSTLTLG